MSSSHRKACLSLQLTPLGQRSSETKSQRVTGDGKTRPAYTEPDEVYFGVGLGFIIFLYTYDTELHCKGPCCRA